MGIELMHETSQFLGGLKLAAGQNRQANFVAEFQDSLDGLKREHSVRRIVTALPLRS